MHTKVNLKTAALLTIAVIAFEACSNDRETQVIPFANPEIYEILKSDLESRSIWFEDIGGNKIKVNANDVKRVFTIAEEAVKILIPPERAASLAKSIQAGIIVELEKLSIPFKLQCFDNSQWVTWVKQHAQRVESNIDEIAANMDPANFGGITACA